MKGGVDEQVRVVQDQGVIDVDIDAPSVALELPGIEAAGGLQADAAAAMMREVLRFDRDAMVGEVGRAPDDHPAKIGAFGCRRRDRFAGKRPAGVGKESGRTAAAH